jgi:hypothetical protein
VSPLQLATERADTVGVDEIGATAIDRLIAAKLGKRPGAVERWLVPLFVAEGETVATAAHAAHDGEAGLLVVTDRRVFHLVQGLRDRRPRITFSVSRAGIVAAAARREFMNTELVLYDPNGFTFLTGIAPKERADEIAGIVAPGHAHAA